MIYIILACVLIFLAVFARIFVKTLMYRDSNGKVRFTGKNFRWSIFTSKLFWGLIGTFAVIYIISLTLPLIWMILTSVKDDFDFSRKNSFGFPRIAEYGIHFENFAIALKSIRIDTGIKAYGFWDMLLNSLIYAGVKPLVSVFWMTVVAYVLSRFKFFGSSFIYALGIFIMMVPITGGIASRMIIYNKIGLYDNFIAGVLMPPSTPFSGMYFMILYGALKAIPQTYSEAAYIDGANEYRVMFRIIIPMIIPTCITLYVLEFINFWNVYQDFLIWYPSSPNLAYGTYKFQQIATNGSAGITDPQLVAGLMIVMIPSLILYIFSQKIMRSNFTLGGLKG